MPDETDEVGWTGNVTGIEIVSSDFQSMGEVTRLLWRDASGFDVVAVDIEDDQVVLPVQHEHLVEGIDVRVEFTAKHLRDAPSVQDLYRIGRAPSVVDLVGAHYKVRLIGPPPGPPTIELPPWWTPEGDQPEPQDS